ncbi:MAG: adenylate/guanylate cyclase domain-containing protein [Pseudomonadota bacterium]
MNAETTADQSGTTDSGARRIRRLAERPLFSLIIAGVAALMTIFAFSAMPQLKLLEIQINDLLRVSVPPHGQEQDKRFSVVTITEDTLLQFPYRSPVDRGFLAEVVSFLDEVEAKGVVLDVLFDQPTEAAKDEALIAAIRKFRERGPVVAAWGDANAGLIPEQLEYLNAFAEAADLIPGFANIVVDEDGVVRSFVTQLEGAGKRSMPAEMAFALTGQEPPIEGVIDWEIGPAGATVFQQLPGHRILQFAKTPVLKERMKDALSGRIVFVGADLEQRDRHQTSLSVDPLRDRTIPGVLIQTHILAQLLDERVVHNASPVVVYLIIGAMAVAGALIGLGRWILIWKAVAGLVLVIVYLTVVYFAARAQFVFLPVALALSALFLSFALAIALDSFLTQRDERFIRHAFAHYLQPDMVDKLAQDPEALRIGGDRREMSFIFTDIQGFTTMSEELRPDQLTRLLNDYFDGMSEIIITHGGAIDKFIGDAVVAHFGAPTPMEDHALQALKCAKALDLFAEDFRKKNVHLGLGVTRIGVHSGYATVGNFGGRSRFDYTAMGDSVNTAARLESSNKRFGTRIGVSEETAEMASSMAGPGEKLPLLQTIGRVSLKGKTKPVTVYTINNDAEEEFVWAYEAAFSLLEVDTEKAKRALSELFRTHPGDPLVKWHIERLENGATGAIIGAR